MKVEVVDLQKRYDAVQAVDGVSFQTDEGSIFGLLGPNGAGKTTIIRMIMNIIAPDSGRILFDGRPIAEEDKDRIGYLPEERGLYKKMLVGDLLLYFASLKNRTAGEVENSIDRWLERFDLSDWKKRKVEKLSKGMSQKVQFIAAIAHDPEIVFLDEPFAGLDPISSDTIREAIVDLKAKGKTILFSTHIMDQAERLCNQIFLINRGQEILSGSLDQVKSRFGDNRVIIEFDGDMSFLKQTHTVSSMIEYPRYIEAKLSEGKSPDDLLQAVVGRVSIRRFEVVSPSLHKIFVEQVGGNGEDDNA